MATLQSTTIDNTTIEQNLNVPNNFSRPNIPVIVLSKDNGGGCYGVNGPIEYNHIMVNSGGFGISNNNSRITIQEAGIYFVHFWTIGHNNCGSTGRVRLAINGSVTSQARSDSTIRYGNCFAYRLFDLNAGDYVEANLTSDFLYFNFTGYNRFSIYKVS